MVLSPANYNARTGLMVCCPMTTRIKGYPFEVPIQSARDSAVLADQVRSLDWRARHAKYKGQASLEELASIKRKIAALIGLP